MDPNTDNPFMGENASVDPSEPKSSKRKVVISAVLIAAGVIAGAAITGTVVANANAKGGSEPSAVGASSPAKPDLNGGDGHQGPDGERPRPPADLTGDALAKVTDAVAAKYPGATIERAGKVPDGTYVAHVMTADGEKYVTLDADFAVTGEVANPGPPGGPGQDGDHGPGEGDHGRGDGDGGPGDDGGLQLPEHQSAAPSAASAA